MIKHIQTHNGGRRYGSLVREPRNVFYHTLWMNSVLVLRRWEGHLYSSNQSVMIMVGSIGMRRSLISSGDWSDGLERQGSTPWPTTNNKAGLV